MVVFGTQRALLDLRTFEMSVIAKYKDPLPCGSIPLSIWLVVRRRHFNWCGEVWWGSQGS